MKPGTIVVIVLLLAMGMITYYFVEPVINRGSSACTAEAKLCPDGSYVGRTGPHCEFAACPGSNTSSTTSILPYTSGIHGVITSGPTCPVERPEEPCPPQLLSTPVAIFHKGDLVHAVALLESDVDGTFAIALPPGEYVVGAGKETFPTCPHTPVVVVADVFSEITIECDSGIR